MVDCVGASVKGDFFHRLGKRQIWGIFVKVQRQYCVGCSKPVMVGNLSVLSVCTCWGCVCVRGMFWGSTMCAKPDQNRFWYGFDPLGFAVYELMWTFFVNYSCFTLSVVKLKLFLWRGHGLSLCCGPFFSFGAWMAVSIKVKCNFKKNLSAVLVNQSIVMFATLRNCIYCGGSLHSLYECHFICVLEIRT